MDQLNDSQCPPELRLPGLETTLDVVWGLQQRDPAAEQTFADQFVPILRRRAYHQLSQRARGVHDTEDIVQSALCDFLRHVSHTRFEHSGVVESLFTTLQREVIRAERGSWNRAESLEPETLDDSPAFAALPFSSYGRKVEAAMRRVAMDALDEQERRAIELRLEGWKPQEIARELGMPEDDTARAFIRRAVEKYQAAYDSLAESARKK